MWKLCKILLVPALFGAALWSGVTVISYLNPRWAGASPINACIANMKQLEGAKMTWALEFKRQTNDVPAWSDLIGEKQYIVRMPECPSNGKYTLPSVGEPPLCSVPGHVLP